MSPEVFGPYLVQERLGAGGMATVHRAVRRDAPAQAIALKRLLGQYAGDAEFVRGFVREARIASGLRHPNIAQTFDLGQVDATYYIAMELVDGVDLRHLLRHVAYSVGPIPAPMVLAIGVQICDALDYAHRLADESGRPLGLVHRDVSPSNVIVGRGGVVKLIDFGIAKASSGALYTASGLVKGKFSYMAPESLDGQTDARSDLFALGVILHELLTARPLFRGETDFATLEQVRRLPVPSPSATNPRVPRDVDHVVMTALQRNPTQRWQSAAQLRSALASMAAPASELWRWIEWALAQPLTAHAWDEGPATRIGAAPAPAPRPASPPVETVASKAKTLFVGDAQPVFASAPVPVPVPVPVPAPVLGPTLIPQAATVISLPPIPAHPGIARPRIGAISIALVLLLCTVAAVGGFFLVDALM